MISVLIKYRILRLLNLLRGMKPGKTRKGAFSWISATLLAFGILGVWLNVNNTGVSRTNEIMGQEQILDSVRSYPAWDCEARALSQFKRQAEYKKEDGKNPSQLECHKLSLPANSELASPVSRVLSIQLLLLMAVVLITNIASRELTSDEWDLEWLVTFPVSRSRLIAMRILERAAVNNQGFMFISTFLVAAAWTNHKFLPALLIGMVLTSAISVIEASLRTVADTGLKLIAPPNRLKNFRALTGLIGAASIFAVISINTSERPFVFKWATEASWTWLRWSPPGLAIEILGTKDLVYALGNMSLLVAEAAAFAGLTTVLLSRMLKQGVVAGGAQLGSRRKDLDRVVTGKTKTHSRSWLTPIQRREVRLLTRDHSYAVQTLVLPIVMLVSQAAFSSSRDSLVLNSFATSAATAFALVAYTLLFSSFQVVNTEGKALWMLYSFPKTLESSFREKAQLWIGITTSLAVALLSYRLFKTKAFDVKDALDAGIVLYGIPIYAGIATCFGVLASDPLAESVQRKVRLDLTYLYMILVAFYSYSIFSSGYWDKFVLVALSSFLALALYQKSKDHLPYLLDPSEAPPPEISLADGMMGAMGFFILQVLCAFGVGKMGVNEPMLVLSAAFALAGAIVFVTMSAIYYVKKIRGFPKLLGTGRVKPGFALAAGTILGAVAVIYTKYAVHWIPLPEAPVAPNELDFKAAGLWVAVTCLAAPLFEEFLFRGVIFRGLDRSWGGVAALAASAGLFAIVHPAFSVPPVFLLGLFTAFAFRKTGALLTPMLIHASYNFVVVVWALGH